MLLIIIIIIIIMFIYFLEPFHKSGRKHRSTQELKNKTFLI